MTAPSAPTQQSPEPVVASPTSASHNLITRDDVLAASDGRSYAYVPVDEWKPGGVLRVSSLSAEMRDELEQYMIEQRKLGPSVANIRAHYVYLCAVDEAGDRIFTSPDDVRVLGNKSAKPIERIFEATYRLNDISDKAVEAEAKNSAGGGSDISSSPSP